MTLNRRLLRPLLTTAVAALLIGSGSFSAPASAVPRKPGQPAQPVTIFSEGFSAAPRDRVSLVTDYTGATKGGEPRQNTPSADINNAGQRYVVAEPWLSDGSCNGIILASSTSAGVTEPDNAYDCPGSAYGNIRGLATAVARVSGDHDESGNRVLSAYTLEGAGNNATQLETKTAVRLTAHRFYTAAISAAATSCGADNDQGPRSRLRFLDADGRLLTGASQIGVSVLDVCRDEHSVSYARSALGGTMTEGSRVRANARLSARAALLARDTDVRVRLMNDNGSEFGNKGVIDNLRILDVTPQLDKRFSSATRRPGQVTLLMFTVTNTAELGAKDGWSFTDRLPAGMRVAGSEVESTCAADVTARRGARRITVGAGTLAVGARSCTIEVPVAASRIGSYLNGPGNLGAVGGLNLPGQARVVYREPAASPSASSSPSSSSSSAPSSSTPPPAGPSADSGPGSAARAAQELPGTGSAVPLWVLVAAGALLVSGGVLVSVGLRRRAKGL
ncbi:hypothetical protein GCM10009841_06200 [Microlunatus panaciterrae]|uniref:Repeat protein (TIGR01451 family) n=1 Tax=Microlunatus panaciterrae TaxID=400768 RepID=A0ABS2RIA4_9ACTN|nr:putative repeat protein (TIGR01451 family) [Microlunatus panaciterrae]